MLTSEVELGWPSGDRPGVLNFDRPVAGAVARAIADVLATCLEGVTPASISALAPVSDPAGRFRTVDGCGRNWFVRVTRRRSALDVEQALLDHLYHAGVAVNPLRFAGLELRWNDETLRLDVRPFVNGTHFSGSDVELVTLGRTLAECHRALAEFEGARVVRSAASRRAERLEDMRQSIWGMLATGDFAALGGAEVWARVNQNWLRQLVEGFDPWMLRRAGAQCVHGEVHAGNVLFADGRAVLLDFEEATHVFAPPAWDLAYAVQRFCLSADLGVARTAERIACLRRGYGGPLPPLVETMRQIAWYMATVVFVTKADEGLATPDSEFAKFIRLTDDVDRAREVLDEAGL